MDYNEQFRRFQDTWKAYTSKDAIGVVVIDLEKVDYIHRTTLITQIGIRTISAALPANNTRFFLIAANRNYRNRFCTSVNNENFAFSSDHTNKNIISRQKDIKSTLDKMVQKLQSTHTKVIIAGWDIAGDLRWLQSGASWVPPVGVEVIDLQAVYMQLNTIHRGSKPSLRNALEMSSVECDASHLHNAGNDAFYTGQMFFVLGKANNAMRPAEATESRSREEKSGFDEAQVSIANKSVWKADEKAWISGFDKSQGWSAYNQVWTPDPNAWTSNFDETQGWSASNQVWTPDPYAWISDFDHIAQDSGTNDHVLTADDEAWKSRSSQDWW